MKEERELVFKDRFLWFKLYDISIGHEYGHILWVDDTEAIMNKSGNYKNVGRVESNHGWANGFFYG